MLTLTARRELAATTTRRVLVRSTLALMPRARYRLYVERDGEWCRTDHAVSGRVACRLMLTADQPDTLGFIAL